MSSSSQVTESWVASFCGLLGHEYFAEVSEDFIEDDFNLTGLQSQVPMYKEALEMILTSSQRTTRRRRRRRRKTTMRTRFWVTSGEPTGERASGDICG